MKKFNINFDGSERIFYDNADYPIYVRKANLSVFPDYTAESHWHDDIELILVLSGSLFYNINGEIITIQKDEGVFINARQFHFGYSETKQDCEFICVLFHPMILCSSKSVETNYINPILYNEHIPFYHFKKEKPWEKKVLFTILKLYEIRNDAVAELKFHHYFLAIWIELCENIITIQKEETQQSHHLSVLKTMILFINQNYKEKLSLKEIAAAGNVGKTSCCNIFKNTINKSPIEYLIEFRLRKSLELLHSTDKTILEISYEVGFFGTSYFTETFRKFYGCTPREYRKNMNIFPM